MIYLNDDLALLYNLKYKPTTKKKRDLKMNRAQRRKLMNGKRRGIGNTRQFSSKRARDKFGSRCLGDDIKQERLDFLNSLEVRQDEEQGSETPFLDAANKVLDDLGISSEVSEAITADEESELTSEEVTDGADYSGQCGG